MCIPETMKKRFHSEQEQEADEDEWGERTRRRSLCYFVHRQENDTEFTAIEMCVNGPIFFHLM
jgi:hypothetical protein